MVPCFNSDHCSERGGHSAAYVQAAKGRGAAPLIISKRSVNMTVFISAHQSNYQLFTLRAARSERFVFPGFESLSTLGAVAKSSHICSSTFLFLGGQSVECRTLHFSAQAKPAHAESVIFVYGKQTCSSFVVLGRLFQAVFGSNSAFPNRPSASRLQSFRILNAVARIKRRVSLLVFPRVRNLPNP